MSHPPVRVVVVTHAGSCDFVLRATDRVGRTRRALTALLHVPPGHGIHMTHRGHRLTDERRRWHEVGLATGDKLYAGIDSSRAVAARASAANVLSTGPPQLTPAQIDAVVHFVGSNPTVVESMLAASPELRSLQQQHPDLHEPEVLRSVLRSQLDPMTRRLMHTANQVQLAQLASMQGGAQVLERYALSLVREMEGHAPTDADTDSSDDDVDVAPPMAAPAAAPMPNPFGRSAAVPTQSPPRAIAIGLPGLMLMLPAGSAGGPSDPASPVSQGTVAAQPIAPPPAAVPEPDLAAADAPSLRSDGAASAFEYSVQLGVLHDLGFEDEASCREALLHAQGDVERAVQLLDEWTTRASAGE